jgi:microcystin-dependent protein
MSEPITPNIGLIVPNTTDLPNAWGTSAININMSALDGMFGGFQALSFSAATTVTLTTPTSGALTPGTGPCQSQNACIALSGTLSGNVVINLTMPGRYVFHNKCVVGSLFVKLSPVSGGGHSVGLPPGQKVTIFFDGTDVDYVDTLPVGAAFDLHGASTVPAWITACTVLPYLLKDGTTYSTATYPALGAMLGSTFGGNGATTFKVPDERGRVRFGVDPSDATGRLNDSLSNGGNMGSSGGDQELQQHSHGVTDPGHHHTGAATSNQGSAGSSNLLTTNGVTGNSFTGITINNAGSGQGGNIPPAVVSFLPLIKT